MHTPSEVNLVLRDPDLIWNGILPTDIHSSFNAAVLKLATEALETTIEAHWSTLLT